MSVQINNKKGFTLIELLIAIAIIGILSATSMVMFTSAQKKARDSQRKNDLNQVKKAMIAARNDCLGGYYPRGTASITTSSSEQTAFTNELLPVLDGTKSNYLFYLKAQNLRDPLNGTTYHYGFKAAINTSTFPAVASVCRDTLSTYGYDGTPTFVLRALLEQGAKDPDANSSYTNCQTIIGYVATWAGTAAEPTPASGDGYYYVCGN